MVLMAPGGYPLKTGILRMHVHKARERTKLPHTQIQSENDDERGRASQPTHGESDYCIVKPS